MRTLVAAGLVAWVACVDQGSGSGAKKVDPKYVAEHLLAAVPTGDVERVDVSIGGKVVYVGSAIGKPTDKAPDKPTDKAPRPPDKPAEGSGDSPSDKPAEPESRAIAPGEMMRITHYWQVVKPVGVGWRVFAFLRGAPNTADFMSLPPTDMQIAHGPAVWKAGEIIADVQDIPLRADWRSPTATLYVGLIAIGEHGVGDRMVASGAHTLDRAVIARVIDVDVSKAPPPPGTVYVPRATDHSDIMLDGAASEPAWASAATSAEFVAAEGSAEPPGKATARLTWDDHFLYAFVSVVDSDVASPYKNHDDPLWKADCVELFIDADRNGRGYVELQVNPNNATFDSWFETTRAKPGDPSWESGMQTAVKVRGTPEAGGSDQGWDAEIAIPWPAVRGRDAAMAVNLPPQVGDRWRLNIVRVDLKTGDKNPTASSWNRISYSDFHALDRMLNVVFADARGSISAQPAGATK
jgi:hypothetical protein